MTTTAPAACVLCEWAPSNTAALLWDAFSNDRYCANPTACAARRRGQPATEPRDHGRCHARHIPNVNSNPAQCALDTDHPTKHRDLDGREWSST